MLHELGKLLEGAILVTADVVGLYPHIPHEEGLSALREALTRPPNVSVPVADLVDLAEQVLTYNLSFNGKHYVQVLRTAIGTKMAPSYANISIGKLEFELLDNRLQIHFSGADLLTIYFLLGRRVKINLRELMNLFFNTINFTFIWSYRYVNFQRVSILLDDGLISTDLYSKPTDKHQHLFHTS